MTAQPSGMCIPIIITGRKCHNYGIWVQDVLGSSYASPEGRWEREPALPPARISLSEPLINTLGGLRAYFKGDLPARYRDSPHIFLSIKSYPSGSEPHVLQVVPRRQLARATLPIILL